MAKAIPAAVRVWRYVTPGPPSACRLWTGDRNRYGYGVIGADAPSRAVRPAHQVMYEAQVGPIPPGHDIDHTCHNADLTCEGGPSCVHRRCVNPAHLEAVTRRTNLHRGAGIVATQIRQTECKRGHSLLDPANIRTNSRGTRTCKVCVRERERERYATARARGMSGEEARAASWAVIRRHTRVA